MHRSLLFLLVLPLLGSAATGPVAAQAPSSGDWRTVSSAHGYAFQVPADWQTLPSGTTPSDTAVQSASGRELAYVMVAPVPSIHGADSAWLAQQFVSATSPATYQRSEVNAVRGPDPVQIANAQAGVAITLSTSDAQGNPFLLGGRAAVRGAAAYALFLGAPEDLYSSDPNVSRILDSFQLVLPPIIDLSPEEAVIAILPYKLGVQDAPGYSAGGISASGPATLAARNFVTTTGLTALGDQSSSPVLQLREFQSAGLVVRYSQPLTPAPQPSAAPAARGTFLVSLFGDTGSAQDYATGRGFSPTSAGSETYKAVNLGASLGEESTAWHLSSIPLGRPATGSYYIRWRRGQVGFSLATADQPLGQEQQSDAERLAAAIDATEQSRPALMLGAGTVPPPVTEDQRLVAAIQLRPFFALLGAAPDGYTPAGPSLFDPTAEVATAGEVGLTPTAMLHKADEQWKELIAVEQDFTNNQDSNVYLWAGATLCADAQSAAADAADHLTEAGWTASSIAAPVQLGDMTSVYRGSGPSSSGSPSERIHLSWTHGALLLSAGMQGPAGTTSLDQVIALAQQVEARFPANPLPTEGVSGL